MTGGNAGMSRIRMPFNTRVDSSSVYAVACYDSLISSVSTDKHDADKGLFFSIYMGYEYVLSG